ncbi:MAG: SMC-Scp complex subunit ScpB [Gammaproteobacteria bacterium]
MEQQQLKNIIEAVLMSADKPLKLSQMEALFAGDVDMPSRNEIRQCLQQLAEDYQQRGFELKEVASGFRIQVGQDYAEWVGRLWEEKPARYTRALLETLALIAYRQPITRGGIEEIRGVSVSSNIIKTLQEREWIKVLGHKDVPGKPALYGTSKEFLDYFNLKSLEELPTLAELKDLDQIHQELDLDIDNTAAPDERPENDAESSGAVPVDDTTADDSQAQSEASLTDDARTGEQVADAETEPAAEHADGAEAESDIENATDTSAEPEAERADDDKTGPRALAAVVAENIEQDPDESEPQPQSAAR